MPKKIRLSLDRRSGEDRREAYSVDYFLQGGMERRTGNERRRQHERRKAWMRISQWSSMRKDLLGADFGKDDEAGGGPKTF